MQSALLVTLASAAATDGFYDKSGIGPHGEHTTSILFRCAAPQPLRF
jgi:hypothetical protein